MFKNASGLVFGTVLATAGISIAAAQQKTIERKTKFDHVTASCLSPVYATSFVKGLSFQQPHHDGEITITKDYTLDAMLDLGLTTAAEINAMNRLKQAKGTLLIVYCLGVSVKYSGSAGPQIVRSYIMRDGRRVPCASRPTYRSTLFCGITLRIPEDLNTKFSFGAGEEYNGGTAGYNGELRIYKLP